MPKRFRHSSRRASLPITSPYPNSTARSDLPPYWVKNTQSADSQTSAPSVFPNNGPSDLRYYGEFWNAYNLEADRDDAELIDGYGGDLDTLLIFAGLFSATNTAFIIESYRDLKQDASEMTNNLLRTLIRNLHKSSFDESQLTPSPKITTRAIRVNTFFFVSLSCSLFAAFGAVIGKQWLNHYEREGQLRSLVARGMERQRKYMGLTKWKFQAVVETLPTLLQFSLFFFFIGLIDFLWPLNKTVASVVMVLSLATILFWFVNLIIGIYHPDSPFQTRLTGLLRKHLVHPIQNPDTKEKEKQEEILMAQCVDWLKERTTTSNVIGVVASAVVLLTEDAKKAIDLHHGGALLSYLLRSSIYDGHVYLGISPEGLQSSLVVLRDLVLKWDMYNDLVHKEDRANASFLKALTRELWGIIKGTNTMDEMSSIVALDILYHLGPPKRGDDLGYGAMLISLLRSSVEKGRVQLGISPEGLQSSLTLLQNLVSGWDRSTDLLHHQDDENVKFLKALSQALWTILMKTNVMDEASTIVAFEILNKLGRLEYGDDLEYGAMLACLLKSSAEAGQVRLGISSKGLRSSLVLLRNLVAGWHIATVPVHPQDTGNTAFLKVLSRKLWNILKKKNKMDEASITVALDILNRLGAIEYGDEMEYGAMLALVLGSSFEDGRISFRISTEGLQSSLVLLRSLIMGWDNSTDLVHPGDNTNECFLHALDQKLWSVLRESDGMDETSSSVALDILYKLNPSKGDVSGRGAMLHSLLRSSMENGCVQLGISTVGLRSSLTLLHNIIMGWDSGADLVHTQDSANASFLQVLSQALWNIVKRINAIDEASATVALHILNMFGQPKNEDDAAYLVESLSVSTSNRSNQLLRLGLLHDAVRSHGHLLVSTYIPSATHMAEILAITMWDAEKEADLEPRRVALRLSWFLDDMDVMYPHVQELEFSYYLSLWRINLHPSPRLSLDSAVLATLYLRTLIRLLTRDQERWAKELDRDGHLAHLQTIRQDASLWSIHSLCWICFILMADVVGRSEDESGSPLAYYSPEWVEMVLHQLGSEKKPCMSMPCEVFYRPNDLMLMMKSLYRYLQTAQRYGMIAPGNALEIFNIFKDPGHQIDMKGQSKLAWTPDLRPLRELKEHEGDMEEAASPSSPANDKREMTPEEEYLVDGEANFGTGCRPAAPSDADKVFQVLESGTVNRRYHPLGLDFLSRVLQSLSSADMSSVMGKHTSSVDISNMLLSTMWIIGLDPCWFNKEARREIVDDSKLRLELRRIWLEHGSRSVHLNFKESCFSIYLYSWHDAHPSQSESYLRVVIMLLSRFPQIWLPALEQDGHVQCIASLVGAPSAEFEPSKARTIQWIALRLFLTMWHQRAKAVAPEASDGREIYLTTQARRAISSFLSSIRPQTRGNDVHASSQAQEVFPKSMNGMVLISSGSTYLKATAARQAINTAVTEGHKLCKEVLKESASWIDVPFSSPSLALPSPSTPSYSSPSYSPPCLSSSFSSSFSDSITWSSLSSLETPFTPFTPSFSSVLFAPTSDSVPLKSMDY